MNQKEREHFIIELVNNVKKDLIKENRKYPKEWDGRELRFRIKDVFSQVVFGDYSDRKRIKDYKNYCLVEGLI